VTAAREFATSAALDEEFQANPLCCTYFYQKNFHWNIQGLPFFRPPLQRANKVTFHSGRAPADRARFWRGKCHPYFRELRVAHREARVRQSCPAFSPWTAHGGGVSIESSADGRWVSFESDGAVIIHAAICEHAMRNSTPSCAVTPRTRRSDLRFAVHARGVESKRGWGHSTWLERPEVGERCRCQATGPVPS